MSTIANNPTSRPLPVLTPSVQSAIDQERFTSVRAIDISEMPTLASIAKLFVLVAAPNDQNGSDFFSGFSNSFNVHELFKRTATRAGDNHIDSDVMIGDVKVNFATMEVSRQGEPLVLTALEFKTLKYLIANARRVISRDELLNEVWGYQNYPSTRTVDNQMAKLRKKLEEDPARPVHLRTVHGVGYKFLP
jgi:DNA-binding winged helix-turn-helix (wHTH) protein